MGETKKYFREQFRVNKFTLSHEGASEFYVASWQGGSSPVPLLCFRLIIFAGCVAILGASLAVMQQSMELKYWPIYMTHWGVVMIAVTSGLALLVSIMAAVKGSIDTDTDDLPWYVKLYWMTYCATIPAAFFITVFYYTLLAGAIEEADLVLDPVLDLFVHGINSVMMLCLLFSARHPVHLLQFIYPLIFTIAYLAFSIIYYYAGGINPQGEVWIYPMLDWSNPGPTTGVVFGSAAFLVIMHIVLVCLSALRDCVSKKCIKRDTVHFVH